MQQPITNPKQRRGKLWLSVLILQSLGLVFTFMVAPIFLDHLKATTPPLSQNGLLNSIDLSRLVSWLFFALLLFNICAIIGIWRSAAWVESFFVAKTSILLFLILSVFLFQSDYSLLFIYGPLLLSLSYLILTYERLQITKNQAQ
jgi:hypothetical protein